MSPPPPHRILNTTEIKEREREIERERETQSRAESRERVRRHTREESELYNFGDTALRDIATWAVASIEGPFDVMPSHGSMRMVIGRRHQWQLHIAAPLLHTSPITPLLVCKASAVAPLALPPARAPFARFKLCASRCPSNHPGWQSPVARVYVCICVYVYV